MAGGPRAGLLTHFYEKGERQLGAFFAAAFDSAQSAAFDSVCQRVCSSAVDVALMHQPDIYGNGGRLNRVWFTLVI